jgi:hypothetical protein
MPVSKGSKMNERTPVSLLNGLKEEGYARMEAFTEILKLPSISGDVVDEVISQLEQGRTFVSDQLAEFTARSRSDALYSAAKAHLIKDPWALIKLHQAEFGDPDIETTLSNSLSKIYRRNDDPLRCYIVESFKAHGSPRVLPLLRGILDDLRPSRDVKRLFSQALENLDVNNVDEILLNTEMASIHEFVILVDSAAISIERRRDDAKPTREHEPNSVDVVEDEVLPDDNGRELSNDPLLDQIISRRKMAWAYLGKDNEAALNHARKTAEAVCMHVYRIKGLEQNNKSARELAKNFDQLINTLEKNSLPNLVSLAVRNIQAHGNFGSHYQDDSGDLTDKHVEPVLMQLDSVVAWFKSYKNSMPVDAESENGNKRDAENNRTEGSPGPS